LTFEEMREKVDRFLGHPVDDEIEYEFVWTSMEAGMPVETLELVLLGFQAGRQLGRDEGFDDGYDACDGRDR
jgi:hypothetical protein